MENPSKIRILVLISGLDIGGAHGGAERFGIELTRQLRQLSCNVDLCAYWKRNSKAETYWLDKLNSENIPVLFASQWHGRFRFVDYIRGIQKLTRTYRHAPLDIIHSHYQMGTLAGILLKGLGCTTHVIRTAHISKEWGPGFASWVCRQIFTKWIYPLLLDAEVGVSQSIVKTLSLHPGSLLRGKKPQWIPNALYPEALGQPQAAASEIVLSLPRERYLIGSIGRLTDQKGYQYLIAAIPQVLEKIPNAHFLLIGEGEKRGNLEQQAHCLGVSDHITFVGQQEQIGILLRAMDLFVLPSLYEGLPTVILESMASGVPVIATDIPGSNELIKDGKNGWLVPPKDSQALARTIIEAYYRADLRDIFRENALHDAQEYKMENIARDYLVLYESIVTKSLPR